MKALLLALRSIIRFRLYSAVNVVSLILSLTCVIVISRYIYGEMSVDHFNKKLDRIYAVTMEQKNNPGEFRFSGIYNFNNQKNSTNISEHQGVEYRTDFMIFDEDEIQIDNQKYNLRALAADSNFLKILDFPIIVGKIQSEKIESALITEKLANKIFGKQDVIGKTFKHSTGKILTITGIIGEPENKSILNFDMIISSYLTEDWSKMPHTLVLLHPHVDYKEVNKNYESFLEMPYQNDSCRYQLFPLKDVYFSNYNKLVYAHGSQFYVYILTIAGFLVLFVGLVNFVNVYTVVLQRRNREFGVKKVFGAGRGVMFLQILLENICMVGIALIFSWILAILAGSWLEKFMDFDQLSYIRFGVILSLILLFVFPFFTAIYPFFRYCISVPVQSLSEVGYTKKSLFARKFFLGFQYVIVLIMIVISLSFIRQFQFMVNYDPGYRSKDIIKVLFLRHPNSWDASGDWDNRQKKEKQMDSEITQQLNASTLFTAWTNGSTPNQFNHGGFQFKSQEVDLKPVTLVGTNPDWLRMLNIQLLEGDIWDNNQNSFYTYDCIVSESALKYFGITNFREAQLQPQSRIWYSYDKPEEMKTNPPYRIIGVVKDFNGSHLAQKPYPVVFYYTSRHPYNPVIASITPGKEQEAVQFLKKLHNETVGGEFTYSFLEDEIHEMYKEDRKIATIYSIFTVFILLIAVLGLFSISLFDIQQRYQEIAIRKVNGADKKDIFRLFFKKYLILLGLSFVIASPIAWYAVQRYLENFAVKASIAWWLFVIALLITAGVSFLTLFWQTSRAADQNPAEVLKSE